MSPLELIKQKYARLSKSQKLIADHIANNKHKVINMVASQLAEAIGTSESTVVRFAMELGYNGYPELIKALQAYNKPILTSKERLEILTDNISNSDPVEYMLNSMKDCFKDNVSELKQLNIDKVHSVINGIIKANKVYLYGNKFLTQYVAIELINLDKWAFDLNVINSSKVLNAKEDDLILVISSGSKDIIFNSLCYELECRKFLITDSCSNNVIDFKDRIVINKDIDDMSNISADMLGLINVIIRCLRIK